MGMWAGLTAWAVVRPQPAEKTPWSAPRALTAIGLVLALSGCAGVAVKHVCLPFKVYSKAENDAAANAVAALPSDSIFIGIIADYKAMRDADRACLGGHL